MHANFGAGGRVCGVFDRDVDRAARFIQDKVMSAGFVREAHGVVAASGDTVVVRWCLRWRRRLLGDSQRQGHEANDGGERNRGGLHEELDVGRLKKSSHVAGTALAWGYRHEILAPNAIVPRHPRSARKSQK